MLLKMQEIQLLMLAMVEAMLPVKQTPRRTQWVRMQTRMLEKLLTLR